MSASTQALTAAIRTRVLTFAPLVGATVTARLNGRLYVNQAPASVVYPYGVMRLTNAIQSPGFSGYRDQRDCEILLITKPRSDNWTIEAVADVIEQALLEWIDVSSGIRFARHRLRDTLPAADAPMDREALILRLSFPIVVWPTYLTQYAIALNEGS